MPVASPDLDDAMTKEPERKPARWQIWVGLFVGLGMAATIGWAVIETYWG